MTKKRLALIAIATVACVCLMLLVAFAMMPAGAGVTRANFDRIKIGMTLAEVKEIIGEEGEFYVPDRGLLIWRWKAPDRTCLSVWVRVDRNENDLRCGCVERKHWHDSDEAFLDKVRRWLHLA